MSFRSLATRTDQSFLKDEVLQFWPSLLGWSEKNFFWKSKKSVVLKPRQMVQNLLKICFWGVAPIFHPATPPNVIAKVGVGGNSRISVTTGGRAMVYGSKSVETPCSYLC